MSQSHPIRMTQDAAQTHKHHSAVNLVGLALQTTGHASTKHFMRLACSIPKSCPSHPSQRKKGNRKQDPSDQHSGARLLCSSIQPPPYSLHLPIVPASLPVQPCAVYTHTLATAVMLPQKQKGNRGAKRAIPTRQQPCPVWLCKTTGPAIWAHRECHLPTTTPRNPVRDAPSKMSLQERKKSVPHN